MTIASRTDGAKNIITGKGILLHNPRTYSGLGHAFKTWNFGLNLSLDLNLDWVKSQTRKLNDTGGRHGTTVKQFLDYFGLSGEIENEKFDEIYSNNQVLNLPNLAYPEMVEYIKKSSKEYDVFFLDSAKHPLVTNDCAKTNGWFKKRKRNNIRSLCDEKHFNISLAIRRGDRVFIPHIEIPSDEWFLNKLKELLKFINTEKPIKVHLFAETYNETWYHPKALEGRKWDDLKKIVHPDGAWLLDEFLNQNFSEIENIYIDEKGKPNDIEGMFSEYNAKLYLNEDILNVVDTLIESDVVVSPQHGSGSLIHFFSNRFEPIKYCHFLKNNLNK